jgi:FkbM family methyltransferase
MLNFLKKIKKVIFLKSESIYYKNFIKDGGDSIIYQSIALDSKSLVIDGGGYEGEFVDEILKKKNCNIYIYEPNVEFFNKLFLKYQNNNAIKVANLALFDKTCKISLSNNDNASSIINNSFQDLKNIWACDVFEEFKKYQQIDLLKLNIEGAEYNVLNRLIDTGSIKRINYILVQFHKEYDDNYLKRNIILSELQKTHKVIFSYNYVWELFIKK